MNGEPLTTRRLEVMAWAAGVSPRESDDWTWGELVAAIDGWHERRREQQKDLALMLYRYGTAFTPGEWSGGGPPAIYEIFPVYSEEEAREIRIAQIRAEMEGRA